MSDYSPLRGKTSEKKTCCPEGCTEGCGRPCCVENFMLKNLELEKARLHDICSPPIPARPVIPNFVQMRHASRIGPSNLMQEHMLESIKNDLDLRREEINRMLMECKRQQCSRPHACGCFICTKPVLATVEPAACHPYTQNSSPLRGSVSANILTRDKDY